MLRVFSEEITQRRQTPVDIITGIFADIARSHSVLVSWSIKFSERQELRSIILKARRGVQNLLECAAVAAEEVRPARSRSRSQSECLFLMLEALPKPAKSGMTIMTSRRVETKISKAFRAMQRRPNMHIGLHYVTQAVEYGLPNNCNVLSGEDKHRLFKSFVTRTNHVNVEKALLKQEIFCQSIQFLLDGSFQHSDPEISSTLQQLYNSCSTVFHTLLSRAPITDNNLRIDDDSTLSIQATSNHLAPQASSCIPSAYVRNTLALPIRIHHLPFSDPFLVCLREAYAHDYAMPFVSAMGSTPLQWCRKISFLF
ncbi:hypothetical protein ACJ73_10186, partial [Blastomyces percursus]